MNKESSIMQIFAGLTAFSRKFIMKKNTNTNEVAV